MFREMKPVKNSKESSTGKAGRIEEVHLKEKNKTFTIKEPLAVKENTPRTSLIPKLRLHNDTEAKGVEQKFTKPVKPLKQSSISLNSKRGFSSPYQKTVEKKTKLPYEFHKKKEDTQKSTTDIKPNSPDFARRLISDPQVFNKIPLQDGALVDFENCIRQISEMWLKTSIDLTNKLENLKSNPPLDPNDFQQEKIKIQMAIQQAKSLTVLKTESVMAEARVLVNNEEAFKSELEYFFCDKTPKSGKKSESFSGIGNEATENPKFGGMGDLVRPREKNDYSKKTDDEKNSGSLTTRIEKMDSFLLRKKDEMSSNQKNAEQTDDAVSLEKIPQEMQTELSKKNDTITILNHKIFQLQKTIEEHIQTRNQFQNKLTEYHEKIQWNHVLWKQIGKLKGRIKEFQDSHEKLENEKRGLEMRVADKEKEIERLKKINQFLNQKFLLKDQDHRKIRIDYNVDLTNNKLLEEKRNSINVLKMVMNLMIDQESLAQKQIAVFQSKIEELEKAANM